MKLRHSLAASLIKHVFCIYFIVTIIVTCTQLAIEYFHIKDDIIADIEKIETTFKPGLSEALWNYNDVQLQAIIMGMNNLSIVTGIRIDKTGEPKFKGTGVILDKGKQFLISDEKILDESSKDFTPLTGLFFSNFDIFHNDPLIDDEVIIGKATIYSYSGVILNRIKYGFFLIIINSIVKTAALWFIIFFFARRIIGRPLGILTRATAKMNPNHPDFFECVYSSDEKKLLESENESGILAQSFDKMRNDIIERIENLQKLRDIGEDLSGSRRISETFTRIMETIEEKFGFLKGAIFLADDKHSLIMKACCPVGDFYAGTEIMHKAADPGEIIYINTTRDDSAIIEKTPEFMLFIPLTDKQSSSSGVMIFSGAKKFNLTDENKVFLQALARLAMISIENIENFRIIEENTILKQDMRLARHIQTLLLPEKPQLPGYDIAASLDPADDVGGDYYDIVSIAGYNWFIIGDVSGHGVPAGLVMMMVQTAIYSVLLENPRVQPSDLLSSINKTIFRNIEKLGESKHMTIVALSGNDDGLFSFSGLHEDILIRRADTGKIDQIETDGMWIGIEPDISHLLSTDTLLLKPGDCMVLFTDGVTESRCKNGEIFGNENLIEVIEKNGYKTAAEVHEDIIDAIEKYEKLDDVTILVIKRTETR